MKKRYPEPSYAFAFREDPPSGNRINGLGESGPRRARPVFHGSGLRALDWAALESFFVMTMPFRLFWQGLVNRWWLRRAAGPVTAPRQTLTPDDAADAVRDCALASGAALAGIARLRDDALFEGYSTEFTHAVVIAMPMDHAEMRHVPEPRAANEVMRVYFEIGRVSIAVAEYIRSLGWPARAYGESADILHIPLAIDAGIGELGKHGSLITREFGPNVRLATVLTTLPMRADTPVDIGVDDLCFGCRRCTIDCPPDAIQDQKQLVRGVTKWYVDFDRCAPYFSTTLGCGICIEVCPWTRPGRGPSLSEKLLAKRLRRTRPAETP